MRVAVWSGLGRLSEFCTGVGKHALNMTCGLSEIEDCSVEIVLSSDLQDKEKRRTEPSRMEKLREIGLPFSRRTGEAMWRVLRWPSLERWTVDVDWIYCPKELYVPVRHTGYAVTVHDLYWLEPAYNARFGRSSYRWRRLLSRSLQEASLVLTVSDFTKRRLVELTGTKEHKIRTVGNGVEDEFFESAGPLGERPSESAGSPYFLSVGGITRKKGGNRLLATARVLARVVPEAKLVVTGPVEREFQNQVAASANVEVLNRGFPNSEMKRLITEARAALVLSEYEGFGIPVLEAMAVGTPVVVANRAALPEVVGCAGLIVDPEDTEETVGVLRHLIDDSPERDGLIERGRAHAQHYKWSYCVDRLHSALNEFSNIPTGR